MNPHVSWLLIHGATFVPFLLLLLNARKKKGLRLFDDYGLAANLPVLIELQLAGILLFGLLPMLFAHPGPYILFDSLSPGHPGVWLVLLLTIVSFMITPRILAVKLRSMTDMTSGLRSPRTSFYIMYFILRALFIIAYESWFRGFFLSDSIVTVGIVWAVAINITLYAILHIVNGKDEFIAAFPYGLLLCGLSIWQGAVWPAMVIHLALTLPYELGFVRRIRMIIAHPV